MRPIYRPLLFILSIYPMVLPAEECPATLDFEVRRLASDETVRLCDEYGGKVLLIVNTASKCAFTSQYEGLEALHEKYAEQGFQVLGFPSNDFGNQDPGSEEEIKNFCRLTYSVAFPMFEKTHASKELAGPLFRKLGEVSGSYPKWNFYKYLLDRDGNIVNTYTSLTKPQNKRVTNAIERLLKKEPRKK